MFNVNDEMSTSDIKYTIVKLLGHMNNVIFIHIYGMNILD